MTRNMLGVNGFVETYAHYGRGLILYDGFDADQGNNPFYRRLVTRELEQPFDPDGLQCSARLNSFVLTTDARLRTRFMAAGQTYRYPVTLVSSQGYKGTVHLTADPVPADPNVSVALEKDAVDLVDSSDVQLTVTTTASAALSPRTIAVRGTDAAGRSNVHVPAARRADDRQPRRNDRFSASADTDEEPRDHPGSVRVDEAATRSRARASPRPAACCTT